MNLIKILSAIFSDCVLYAAADIIYPPAESGIPRESVTNCNLVSQPRMIADPF